MAKAKIIEIKASGAVVLLEDKEKAWLPAQELSINYIPSKKLSQQELCSEGQELDVIVYGRELGGKHKLVSHVRFTSDPWNKVKTWTDGDAKEMEIHSVTASRAYGRIESGIEGYVELADIYKEVPFPRSWKNFKTLRAGDVIAGCVDSNEIDSQNRLVKLNAAAYFKTIAGISQFLPTLKKKGSSTASQREKPGKRDQRDRLLYSPSEIRHMLVVDDSRIFLSEMGSYLKSCGIDVTAASSKNEATTFLSDPECPDFDAAVLDVNLAQANDYIGFQVAKAVARIQPRCKIIMATGDRFDSEKLFSVAGNLCISGFLYKPFGIEELNQAVSSAMADKPKRLEDFFTSAEEKTGTPDAVSRETRSLTSVVCELKEEIFAEAVTLFSIHPLSYEVRIEEHCGVFQERAEEFLAKMRYSPVRDVAMEKETIVENKISRTPKFSKHRWLVRAMKYESCIGFPVEAAGELNHCLFAFHGNENHFDQMDRYKVKSTADEIAQLLEIQKLQETIRSENPFFLAGKTYGSMAHDLVEALNREFGLPAVFEILDDKNSIGAEEIKNIKGHLETFRDELSRARGIVKTFRRMSRSQHEKETEVDIFDTVNKVAENIKVETGAYDITITVHPMEKETPAKMRMNRAAFEQVMYNLFLNASQQIQRFSFTRQRGAIAVEFAKAADGNDEDKRWLQILIHDSGPGIHGRDFDRIFQKGYTTKEDGCGMGLDICRNILEQAGGTIGVLKSILFCGTTFEIRLPVNPEET